MPRAERFTRTFDRSAGGSADISGKAGPINAGDAAKTPFEAKVKVDNMDIVASGFIDPASGIAGLANFDGTLNSNGSVAKAVGTFTGNKLQFSPKGSPASKTVVIKHSVDVDLDQQSGNITQGDVEIGKAVAHLTGSFKTQGETQILDMKLNGPNMPVEELEAMQPLVLCERGNVAVEATADEREPVRRQIDDRRAQLMTESTVVVRTLSSKRLSTSPIFSVSSYAQSSALRFHT